MLAILTITTVSSIGYILDKILKDNEYNQENREKLGKEKNIKIDDIKIDDNNLVKKTEDNLNEEKIMEPFFRGSIDNRHNPRNTFQRNFVILTGEDPTYLNKKVVSMVNMKETQKINPNKNKSIEALQTEILREKLKDFNGPQNGISPVERITIPNGSRDKTKYGTPLEIVPTILNDEKLISTKGIKYKPEHFNLNKGSSYYAQPLFYSDYSFSLNDKKTIKNNKEFIGGKFYTNFAPLRTTKENNHKKSTLINDW